MSYFCYHRCSTAQQRLDRGLLELEEFCKSRGIMLKNPPYTDKQTGKNFNRPRYIVLKEDVLRDGDTLIITEVDRLGRNKREILRELQDLKERGVRVMILELPTTLVDVDIADPLGKLIFETIQNMVIELYACLAQAEVEKKEIRQRQGIEAMKARGDWERYGRPKVCE
ncbi:MAG: recombinase family protein, partial [Prevotella sp.]|nr:recombinase family protein [Prevotella sp.]